MDDKTRELLMKAADDWASAARLLPGYRNPDLLALKERCHAHVRAIRAALAAAPALPAEPVAMWTKHAPDGEWTPLYAHPAPAQQEELRQSTTLVLSPEDAEMWEDWIDAVKALPKLTPTYRAILAVDALVKGKSREAAAYKWAYEYLQERMRSIGRNGWAADCDGEIEARIKGDS